MREDVHDIILARSQPPKGANKILTMSIGVHVLVVAIVIFMPRSWLSAQHAAPKVMTITLSGSVGPKSTGMTAIGSRPTEAVAPEPKRPEPERLVTTKPDAMVIPDKSKPKP